MRSRLATRLWAATLALICVVGSVRSEPFEKERCDALAEEHGKLVAGGVPEVVRKGPQWAADNVSAERVKEARRFLALEEALLFRCGHAKLRAAPPPPEAAAAAGGTGAGTAAAAAVAGAGVLAAAKAKAGARKTGKAATAVKPGVAKAARSKPGKGEPGAASAAAATAKPKPAPKPNPKAKAKDRAKADDAYRPPAKTSGVTN